MSRTFWVAVGAIGGIAAYRRGERAARRAKELGPLGTAEVIAHGTSRAAGRTANGLGRINTLRARREGRLVLGSVDTVEASLPLIPTPRESVGRSAAQQRVRHLEVVTDDRAAQRTIVLPAEAASRADAPVLASQALTSRASRP